MKNVLFLIIFLCSGLSYLHSQSGDGEETGLPGDHFSLEGALDLFSKAESPEAFEKALNAQENNVNNLDLNGDGDIDYIRVVGKQDGDVHLFILQVPVSENENQDIAVIEIEKTGKDQAILQIVGDEDIFGEELIIEPSDGEKEEDMDEVKSGPSLYSNTGIVVNVWLWPSVRFIYAPGYRPWVSPWRWRVYPNWWRPWRPLGFAVWHPLRVKHYRPTIRVVNTHRVVRAHNIYKPVRVSSTTVRTRHAGAHVNYKVSSTKTKVTGPRGNSATKTTTKIKGKKGQVKTQKTTVKRSRRGN